MRFEQQFEIPTGRAAAWALLLDVERIAPCFPGAELTEVIDDRTFKGKVNVRLGAISLSFEGDVQIDEMSLEDYRVVMRAIGRESRGRGAAEATVSSHLVESGSATRVLILTDLKLTGRVAQFGHGMIEDVSGRLSEQFADCVRAQLAGGEEATAAIEGAQRPLSGIRLALGALYRAIRRGLRKLVSRGQHRRD